MKTDQSVTATESGWLVPLSDVLVHEDLRTAVEEAVDSGWWSMGPRVEEFERAFGGFVDGKHALAVANGTAALHLALLAAGVGSGDEVVLPSINFVAAAKAVVVLHYGGFPCDMDAVRELAERRGLLVVEDAAHAPGSTYRGERCGSLGLVSCFSFFSNKNLPVGEGGMIVTNDDGVAERVRLLRSHGMTTLTWERHKGHAAGYDVVAQGFNYRLDELRAAMGHAQLLRLPAENAARAQIAGRYRESLDGVKGMTMPFGASEEGTSSSHHLAVVLLPEGTPRDDVRASLTEARIQTSVHYPPIHRFTFYEELGRKRPLPQTEAVAGRILTLPLYAHMTDEQVELVVTSLLDAL
jgi:dTDP-4-amino-4,6-dideoxygalactose transaminase